MAFSYSEKDIPLDNQTAILTIPENSLKLKMVIVIRV